MPTPRHVSPSLCKSAISHGVSLGTIKDLILYKESRVSFHEFAKTLKGYDEDGNWKDRAMRFKKVADMKLSTRAARANNNNNDTAAETAALITKQRALHTALLAEKDALLAAKDTLLAEKDALLAEKDAQLAEKDALLAEKDAQLERARRGSS